MAFYKRFEIDLPLESAHRRFVNRCKNIIWANISPPYLRSSSVLDRAVMQATANAIGIRYDNRAVVDHYVTEDDLLGCLQAIEAVIPILRDALPGMDYDSIISELIAGSETDLSLAWDGTRFLLTGAQVLDEKLVAEQLEWLQAAGYSTVREAFGRGLKHLLQGREDPAQLSDAITDSCEALEAMAKVVTGNDRDLSSNRDLLVKRIGASEDHRSLLKAYLKYANNYRHAGKRSGRAPVSLAAAEFFAYATGAFLRLCIETLKEDS